MDLTRQVSDGEQSTQEMAYFLVWREEVVMVGGRRYGAYWGHMQNSCMARSSSLHRLLPIIGKH